MGQTEVELQVMNVFNDGREMHLVRLKNDNSERLIKPGRIYLAEIGDKFKFKGTQIYIELTDQQPVDDDDFINAATLVQPKRLQHKPQEGKNEILLVPKIERNKDDDNKNDDIFNASTQVMPGILKKKEQEKVQVIEKNEEVKDDIDEKQVLDDMINQPTLIMPKKNLEKVNIVKFKDPEPRVPKEGSFILFNQPIESKDEFQSTLKNISATNAPTLIIKNPLMHIPDPPQPLKIYSSPDDEAPTLLIKIDKLENPQKARTKVSISEDDLLDQLINIEGNPRVDKFT